MSQNNVKWTAQQVRAIKEHARNVCVCASAGTGKTAVMSGSCVDAVTNASACPDVWSILVVTFTDMAAEQMRSRIARQLSSAIESAKDVAVRQHLRRQLILLGAADISTIHSFCKRLISGYFYQLELDPTFGIIDADEAKLLKAEVLEKTIDWAWKQDDLAIAMRQLLARRDLRTSEGFPARIINISEFLDGVVSRDDWFERARILTETTGAGDLAQGQKQIIEEQLQNALGRLNFALKVYKANNPEGEYLTKYEIDYIGPVRQLSDWLKAGKWVTASAAIAGFVKPTAYAPKDAAPELGKLIQKMVKGSLDVVEELKDLAILNPDYLSKFSGAVGIQTMAMVKLTKQFDQFYKQAKKSINCLDFADLEHYALRLLGKRGQESFSIEPSETALELRKKYKYIFVDECQDINSVQQAILDMVSSPDNVFSVGDPKQSIYQWRGAKPEIFLEQIRRASVEPKSAGMGLRVDLNVNFRSDKPILDFVNKVFCRIMTASFADIDYDQSAYLQPPQDSPYNATNPAVELHLLDKAQNDTDDHSEQTGTGAQSFSNRQLEAAMIARRIKQMVGADPSAPALQILDKQTGASRPVEYRDIVILMRSLASKSDFIEVLRLGGVPVSSEATAGYFEATEITDMLSLLKVLDNPRRDIELAAALRSPFFNLTDTELAKIRLWSRRDNQKLPFYDCVLGYSRSADDKALAEKLGKVLATLDDWRTVGRRGRLAELIWHIYRRTGLLSFVCAMPDGLARRANLLKLHDRAIQFEGFAGNSGVASLTRFIEFVEKLLAAGQDWSPAVPEAAAGNTVRVLSVHKSKGLEFPVVFVADLEGRFNNKDSRQDCLVDEQMTLGLRVIDVENNTKLDSIGYQVIERRARRKSLAEEMRILYVAMTRAINHLVLVGCIDKQSCENKLKSAGFFKNETVPDWFLDSCQNHLDWILCGLGSGATDDKLYSIQFYDQPRLNNLSAFIQSVKIKTKKLKVKGIAYDLNLLKKSLNWKYPFGDAPKLPAKRTVSQWTHRNDEFAKFDYSSSFKRMPKTVLPAENIDGKSIGSATHLVISLLDLSKPITTESITALITKLTAGGAIAENVASLINADSILNFFQTDLGHAALDKNNLVQREWPFTFAVPASQWTDSEQPTQNSTLKTNDSIIVQGIIDLLIQTPKGLLIIDFKTDDVSADSVSKRAEIYRTQLDLYARAAAAITGQTVSAKWLYFLKPGCEIQI